jgi:sulfate permease, SulP family
MGPNDAHHLLGSLMPAWARGYDRRSLAGDAAAGLTVWALVVPESMAYASIAGVPVQFGLYAVPLALLAYVWLGSSPRLFFGPSSTVAALIATIVAPLAASDPQSYVPLAAALAIVTGLVYLAMAVLRMGFLSRLLAQPVLDGFIVGLGVFIAVGQLYKVVGAEKPPGNTVQQLVGTVTAWDEWATATVVVGVGSLAILFAVERVAPKVPGALLVVVVSLLLVPALGLTDRGVEVVGDIPAGFAFVPWTGITVTSLVSLLPGALAVIVVGFSQSLAIAKAYGAEERTSIDANRELMAYGAASIGAGVLQGFPGAGGLSKSAAAKEAGARSPVAFLVTGALVVLTVLFLTGVFVNLPEAVLGAVVIHAVFGMIKPLKIWRLRQVRVPDFWLALGAFLGVVLIGVLAGVVVGVVLSMILLLERLSRPHVATLGRHCERGFVDLDAWPDAAQVPRVLLVRPDGPLVFANAEAVLDTLRTRLTQLSEPPDLVVLNLESCYEIDVTAADALADLVRDLQGDGIEVRFAVAHRAIRDYVRRLHIAGLDSLAQPYPTVEAALTAPRIHGPRSKTPEQRRER